MSTTVNIALDASSVQTVTVHQSVAEVTRKIKLTLKDGPNVVTIRNLSSQVDLDSIRLQAPHNTSVRVQGTTCKIAPVIYGTPSGQHAEQLTKLHSKRALLECERIARQKEIELLDESARSVVAGRIQSDFDAYATTFVQRRCDAAKAIVELNEQLVACDREIATLSNASKGEANAVATATVFAERSGAVEFQLTYAVTGVTWTPYYDLYARTTDGQTSPQVVLHYCGSVTQCTGEDWRDTTLILSTASTQSLRRLVIPTLTPVKLSTSTSLFGTTPAANPPASEGAPRPASGGLWFGRTNDAPSQAPGPFGGSGGSGAAPNSSTFGGSAGFGATQSTTPFGAQNNGPFGGGGAQITSPFGGSGAFGAASASTNAGPFGGTPGASASPSNNAGPFAGFGASTTATPGTGGFGGGSTGFFGQTSTTTSSSAPFSGSLFGSQTTTAAPGGSTASTQPAGSVFAASWPSAGTQTSAFGAAATTSGAHQDRDPNEIHNLLWATFNSWRPPAQQLSQTPSQAQPAQPTTTTATTAATTNTTTTTTTEGTNGTAVRDEPISIVDRSPVAATYRLRDKTCIASDGSPHRLPIARLELAAELTHVCVPRKSTGVFVQARVRNASAYALLAGPVNVFVDDSLVAKTAIPLVGVNESFECVLGVDTAPKVAYESSVRTTPDAPPHAFSPPTTKTVTRTTSTTVTNGGGGPLARIIVRDAIPLGNVLADLRVDLRRPAGLARARDGEDVVVDVSGDAAVKVEEGTGVDVVVRWCRAEANGGVGGEKDGLYEWVVGLPAGKKVVLVAEWDVKTPIGATLNEGGSPLFGAGA